MVLAHFNSGGVPKDSPFAWESHPDVLVVGAILVVGYWLALRRLGPRLAPSTGPVVTRRQIRYFALAIGAYLVLTSWPLHDLAEGYLLSAHMVQHAGLTLVLPPLLLLGTPPWLLGWIVRPGTVARFLTRPVVSLIAYAAVGLLSHAPPVANAAIRYGAFHLAVHVALVGSSLLMWRHVVGFVPGAPAISSPFRWGYLLIAQLPLGLPASALLHADTILYQAYEPFPAVWGWADIVDQRHAGEIMTVIESGLTVLLAVTFLLSAKRTSGGGGWLPGGPSGGAPAGAARLLERAVGGNTASPTN